MATETLSDSCEGCNYLIYEKETNSCICTLGNKCKEEGE